MDGAIPLATGAKVRKRLDETRDELMHRRRLRLACPAASSACSFTWVFVRKPAQSGMTALPRRLEAMTRAHTRGLTDARVRERRATRRMSWITSRSPRDGSPTGSRERPGLVVVDEFIDSWICWREACEDVRGAYERWRVCSAPQRGLAFASYRAAVDREDQAARVYAFWTDRLRAGEG